jgi:hypothetical protein
LDPDELIDRWTLVGDELNLVACKRGVTKLGFAQLLRFYSERDRFPRQTITGVSTTNPHGTVRPTARCTRLRAEQFLGGGVGGFY